jgi:hypothetical protein
MVTMRVIVSRDDLPFGVGYKFVVRMAFVTFLNFLSVAEEKVTICEEQNKFTDVTGDRAQSPLTQSTVSYRRISGHSIN